MPLTPDELEKLEKRVMGLKQTNRNFIQEIANAGAQLDLGTARVEMFAEYLIGLGLITNEDRLDEQEKWELHVREAVRPIVDKVREMARDSGQEVRTNGGLIIPPR